MKYHETLIMGAIARVYEDGSVEVVSEPKVPYCTYMRKVYGIRRACEEVIEYVLKLKMNRYGLFTPRRRFDLGRVVVFGTSEIISWGIEKEFFDCAVIVCDGAGTVVAKSPQLVQGIGAVMNGLLKTYSIPEVINTIEKLGGVILDRNSADIDQVEGVIKAIELGCKNIAVSVIGLRCWEISEIRRIESKHGANLTVFSTCNTLAKASCITHIEKADYVCTSANQMIRESLAKKALIQLGVTIPVYILTKKIKDLVLEYMKNFDEQFIIRRATLPYEEEYTTRCTYCEWL
ncbi:MAG: DUF2099 family protein [Ignisphaera sp.]|uniref:DUF2099 family protein n=1 Tax=Ignisphaera aggregans TaxID=334771 RepID=A0A7C4NMV4_9CREN